VITPGRTGRLAFDFNLAASNTVDLTASTVTVSPTLVATVVPSDTKQIRVRGQFASATANDFVLNVQPFHDVSGTMGQVTVDVAPTTTYQINGTAFVGAAGFTALAALPANTMVAAFGSLQTGTQTFTATNVLAGTSLENPSKDQVSGTVVARTATSLTVRGATSWERGGDFEFEHHDVMVSVAAATGVTEEGMMGAFTVADISVGQHIDAFGMLSTTPVSGSGSSGSGSSGNGGSDDATKTLDASAGEVRLDLTPAWGVVTTLATGDQHRRSEPDRLDDERAGTRSWLRDAVRHGAARLHCPDSRQLLRGSGGPGGRLGAAGYCDGFHGFDGCEHVITT
jgi:hypothetical protein